MKLIFNPSGTGHHFRAHIVSGYVDIDKPGMIDVTKEQADKLVVEYPDNFSWPSHEKAAPAPTANKMAKAPGKNKGRKKGGDR